MKPGETVSFFYRKVDRGDWCKVSGAFCHALGVPYAQKKIMFEFGS
ncbi:MAG: hypothetical protein WC406_06820 [Methanoregula sp.]|jgi:hypothetical protein|nr:hypothetical protein [Methanoregula sp.]